MANVIVENLFELARLFSNVATTDPLSALLMLVGTVLTLFSIGFFGYLTLGAIVDLIVPEIGRSPPQQG